MNMIHQYSLVALGGRLAFAGWSGYTFRVQESLGLAGELYTGGPYRYSRNPQCVGIVGVITEIGLIVNATLLCIGVLPMFVWIWLLPRAEEPWLHERFGETYEEYRESVPRFLVSGRSDDAKSGISTSRGKRQSL